MLQVVVSAPRPFAGTDFTKYKDLIDKNISEGHTVVCLEYLHGKVEDAMGYDIGALLSAESVISGESWIPGIYDVEVVGYTNPCKLFAWNANNCPRALCVDPSVKQDLLFAQSKYNNRDSML